MKPEAQRIAIAEACGWMKFAFNGVPYWSNGKVADGVLPDYLSDLNAMHEAEKVLTKEQRDAHAEYICDMLLLDGVGNWTYADAFVANHATAAQRAEAFLRTIGKWEADNSA